MFLHNLQNLSFKRPLRPFDVLNHLHVLAVFRIGFDCLVKVNGAFLNHAQNRNKFSCWKVAIFDISKAVNKKIGNCEHLFS